jgi:hypothetical protein
MTSAKAVAANQRNARRCTGPRTAVGKRRVGENALRHGLRTSLGSDLALSGAVARIAAALAGPDAPPGMRALVTPIAEAQVDMLRIRSARARLIDLAEASLPASDERQSAAIAALLPKLVVLDRYERSAMRRRHRALRELRKSFTMMSK